MLLNRGSAPRRDEIVRLMGRATTDFQKLTEQLQPIYQKLPNEETSSEDDEERSSVSSSEAYPDLKALNQNFDDEWTLPTPQREDEE